MSFTEKLGNNQRNFAEEALLRTISEDPNQTIGEIWESLEGDADSEFMWDLFKKLTIGRLVTAAVQFAQSAQSPAAEDPAASAPAAPAKSKSKKSKQPDPEPEEAEDEEEDDFDDDDFDDDEFDDDDDDFDDDDDDDDEPEKRTRKSKKTSKAKSKKKSKSKSTKKDNGHLSGISGPDGKKKYQASILKFLKSKKARSEEKALRSTEIREEVGGDPKQFRDNINQMIDGGSVEFTGQARGMKYYLA